MADRGDIPDTTPRWDQIEGKQWGQTPEPVMEPAAKPSGAKTAGLALLGLVVLAAIVVLVAAIISS